MHTPLCDQLGIEFPIFAFTHCRDVVVAVSKAGGFGVLGAVGFTPGAARDRAATGSTSTSATTPTASTSSSRTSTRAWTPTCPPTSSTKMLRRHGAAGAPRLRQEDPRPTTACPLTDEDNESTLQLLGWTEATATPQVEVALQAPEDDADRQRARHPAGGHDRAHPRRGPQGRRAVRLAVARRASTPTPASTSSSPRAARPAGTAARSARSCCGRRWSRRSRRFPVLAAGGIGSGQQIAAALALGAQGAWTGSQWLMVEEAENTPVQQAAYVEGGQPRHRPQPLVHRQAAPGCCSNDWTEAWENPDNPEAARDAAAVHGVRAWPSPPRTSTRTRPSTSRSTRSARSSASSPRSRRPSAVIERWVQEYLEATNTLNELNEAASV